MITFPMQINFQHTTMAPEGSRKGKGMGTAKKPKSVINQRFSLDQYGVTRFILEDICKLIDIYHVCDAKDSGTCN
jgi:hypothetical protein